MTLVELRAYVRDLTGVYSTDLLPDALLDRWIQESYSKFNRSHDWPWMVSFATGTLPAGQTLIPINDGNGRTREVALTYPNGLVYQVPTRKSLIQTVDGDDGIFYDHDVNGNIILSKAATEDVVYHVDYIVAAPVIQTSGKATEIPAEYEGLLAYATAVKVLMSQADDTNRAPFYNSEYEALLDDLHLEYTLDEDLGPIQIGGEILRVDGRTLGRVNLRYRSS